MLPEQERIQFGWETCIIQEANTSPRVCSSPRPDFLETDVSLCLGPSLGCAPWAASPTCPGKSKFKSVAMLMVGVVLGELPSVRSSGGCLKINRGGLKKLHVACKMPLPFPVRGKDEDWHVPISPAGTRSRHCPCTGPADSCQHCRKDEAGLGARGTPAAPVGEEPGVGVARREPLS